MFRSSPPETETKSQNVRERSVRADDTESETESPHSAQNRTEIQVGIIVCDFNNVTLFSKEDDL